MKRFGFISGLCFWLCMIISCATLQEVNVNLDEEEQNLDIIICEQKFAELDAKLIFSKNENSMSFSASQDFIKECNSLLKIAKKGYSNQSNTKAVKARFLALSGKTNLLIQNVPAAKKFYSLAQTEYKGDIQAALLAFRLDSSFSLENFNTNSNDSALIQLEKAILFYEQKDYVQAVANFDSAFISLPEYYKKAYSQLRESSWNLRNLNSKYSDQNKNLLAKSQITVSEMLQITKSETNYIQKIIDSKIKTNSDLYKKAKEFNLITPVSINEKSLKNEKEPSKENQIVTKSICARFLWNLYCNLKGNPSLANRYSKIYGPKNLTPIPDILPSSPDFDACLGVIENEIMSLEDGTYFFGSTPVSALDFCTYLEKLE